MSRLKRRYGRPYFLFCAAAGFRVEAVLAGARRARNAARGLADFAAAPFTAFTGRFLTVGIVARGFAAGRGWAGDALVAGRAADRRDSGAR